MKRNKKITALIISAGAILASAGIVTATTYSLFSDNVVLSNHLVGGNLDITLKRTNLIYTYIDSEGMQKIATNDSVVDFSTPTEQNIFDFSNDQKFIPTDYREAKMQLSNSSTVAYAYFLEIKLTGESAPIFAEQLSVSIDTNPDAAGGEYAAKLSDGLVVGSASEPIGIVKVGSATTFTVKISFYDLLDNNDAQNKNVYFDFIVHAVQKVTE